MARQLDSKVAEPAGCADFCNKIGQEPPFQVLEKCRLLIVSCQRKLRKANAASISCINADSN